MIESGSSIGTFLECPKKYFYKYEKMYSSPGYNSALGFGSFFHALIHSYAISHRGPFTDEVDRYMKAYPQQTKEIELDVQTANRCFILWKDYWELDSTLSNKTLKFEKPEYEWIIKGDKVSHVGKSDGVVYQKSTGKTFLYEFKTASDRDRENYIARVEIDRQLSANITALKGEGIPIDGVIYDIFWKPSIRIKTGRKTMPDETIEEFVDRFVKEVSDAPSSYFSRHLMYRSKSELDNWAMDVNAQLEVMDKSRKENKWYRNTGACFNYNRKCEFFSACLSGNDEILESICSKRDRKLPELSLKIQKE